MTEITCTNWDSPRGRPYTAAAAELFPLLAGEGRLWIVSPTSLLPDVWTSNPGTGQREQCYFRAELVPKAGIRLYICWYNMYCIDTIYLVTGYVTWLVFLGLIYPVQIGNDRWNLGQEAWTFIYKGEVHCIDISISTLKMRRLRFRDVCDQVAKTGANMMREMQVQN